jgi:cytochrome P450
MIQFIGLVAAIFSSYFLYLFFIQCWKFRHFRGPFAIPLFGCVYNAEPIFFMKYLANMRRHYGKVFTFFAFTKPFLIVSDPTIVRRVLSDTKTFTKGKDYTSIFAIGFGNGLVTSVGEKHQKDRSVFGKYFIRSSVSNFTGKIHDITEHAIDGLLKGKEESRPVNILDFFATLALRTFMQFAVGSNLADRPEFETEICHQVSYGSNVLGQMVVLNLKPWMVPHMVKSIERTRLKFHTLHVELVKQRRLEMKNGAERKDDCLQAMIEAKMPMQEIDDHLITLLCAGHDTTAYFCGYFAYLLAINPSVQDKLLLEMETKSQGRELTADDIVEMKYLTKVMQETVRLYAVIPFVTRLSTQDMRVGDTNGKDGVVIPKDTTVIIPLYLINRDPDLWDNPTDFNPDRFEDSETNFTSAKNGFFPFGYGSRTCIGNTLAHIESAIFICQLLRRYRIEPDPTFTPKIRAGISLTTTNGINVVLRSR